MLTQEQKHAKTTAYWMHIEELREKQKELQQELKETTDEWYKARKDEQATCPHEEVDVNYCKACHLGNEY